MRAPAQIYPHHQIEAYPVVATGRRWPCAHEILYGADWRNQFLGEHPGLAKDARRRDLLLERPPPMPEPGARGGGLFPVLVQVGEGGLAAVTRTGAPHIGSGGELSLSVSNDAGRTWSEPAVVVRGDVAEDMACLDPALDGREEPAAFAIRARSPG